MEITYDTGLFGVDEFGANDFGGYEEFDLAQSARGDRGRKSEQWDTCSRCGFTFPLSELRLQLGDGGAVKVCQSDFDEPSVQDLRPDELPVEKPFLFVDENGPNG